jgi:hypothetical protein
LSDQDEDSRGKTERSPSYPFISLRKAVERAQALYNGHRKEPTRLAALADTWSYSPSSSGLQQTVAAMKQFGLLEDVGSGAERKVQISDLARRILADLRPGVKEQAIAEAARRPRLIAEYLPKWLPDRPSDAHCISELHFDRGFGQPAAKVFLKVFDETVAYANLRQGDTDSDVAPGSDAVDKGSEEEGEGEKSGKAEPWKPLVSPPAVRNAGAIPLSERLQVVTTGNQLTISAALVSGREVDKLIRILQANKALLDDEESDDDGGDRADAAADLV